MKRASELMFSMSHIQLTVRQKFMDGKVSQQGSEIHSDMSFSEDLQWQVLFSATKQTMQFFKHDIENVHIKQ